MLELSGKNTKGVSTIKLSQMLAGLGCRIFLYSLLAHPCLFAEQPKDFWLPGCLYRREVTLSKVTDPPGGKLASARFFTGDKKDASADSVRVTTAAGKEVLFEVIYWHPRNSCIILFETVKGQQSYYVFYGGKVGRSRYRKQFRKGLFMETREWGSEGSCKSWEETQKLIATSRQSYGALPVSNVRRKDNRFNKHDSSFISLFNGTIHIPKAGPYYLLTRSNDASFVFIDGKKVVEFPGTRGKANPRKDEYLSPRFRLDALPGLARRYRSLEAVQLSAGDHTFKYVHVQAGGSTVAWFGLLPPGSRRFVVPSRPYFFSEFLPTTPGVLTVRNKPFFVSASSVRHSHQVIATMQFTRTFFSCAVTRRHDFDKRDLKILWDFGDGTTLEGTARSHIYFKTGRFPVTVKVTDGRGNLDAFTFEVLAKQTPPDRTPRFTTERMLIDLLGENFEHLDKIDPYVFSSCWQLAAYTSTWKEKSDYFGHLARAYAKWYPADPAACLSELFESAFNAAIRSKQSNKAMALSEEAIRALTGRTRRQLDFALRRMGLAVTARDHVKTIAWADEVLVSYGHVASEDELERANIAKAEASLSQLKIDAARKVLEGMKTRRASLPSEKEVLIDAIFKGAVETFLRERNYVAARGICNRRTFYEPMERLNPLVCQLLAEVALAEKKYEPALDFVARARKLTKKELYPGDTAIVEASCHFMNDRLQESRRIMREIQEKSKDVSLLSRTRQLWAQAGKRAAELVAQYQKELPELLAQADAARARKMLDALRAADPRTAISPEFVQFEKQVLQLEKDAKPKEKEAAPEKVATETRAALGPNLLRNPSFERLDPLTRKLAHWTPHETVTLNRVTSDGVSGRFFVELQRRDRRAGSITFSSDTFTIPPGGTIVMEQYCRAIGAPKELLLHLYLEAGGKRTHYHNGKVNYWWSRSEVVLPVSPTWKEARVHLVFPAVPAGVKINVDEVAVMVYE